jgi:hypothetical protein
VPALADLDLVVRVNGRDAATPPGPALLLGDQVRLEYVASNTGGSDLWALYIWDDTHGRVTCPTRDLPAGSTVTCVIESTADVGPFASGASAQAWDDVGAEFSDTTSYHFVGIDPNPRVDLETYVEGFDGDSPPGPRLKTPGELLTFTYVVTNAGAGPLTNVLVTDDYIGTIPCPLAELAPGEVMTCEAQMATWLDDIASGAVVEAWSGTARLTDRDPTYWHTRNEPRIHDLTIEVSVNGEDADTPTGPMIEVGRSVQLTYFIRNGGNSWVNAVEIRDPFVAQSRISCPRSGSVLEPGETVRCTATVAAEAGQYASLVQVVAWDNDGRRVIAEDPVHYYGIL